MVVDWSSFRDSIENTFYNETINIYEVSQIQDGLGAVVSKSITPLLTKKCNIQNSRKDIVKKEFGMDIDAKFRISLNNDINLDEKKKYIATLESPIKNINSNIQYEVTSVQPFNTYVLLLLSEISETYEVVDERED